MKFGDLTKIEWDELKEKGYWTREWFDEVIHLKICDCYKDKEYKLCGYCELLNDRKSLDNKVADR